MRASYLGAVAAWVGFTLPSAVALVLFAYGVDALGGVLGSGWLHGLKVVAVAVVAQAVLRMMCSLALEILGERAHSRSPLPPELCWLFRQHGANRGHRAWPVIVGLALRKDQDPRISRFAVTSAAATGALLLALFFALLIDLPVLAGTAPKPKH